MSDPIDIPLTPADIDQIVAALEGSNFATLELATPRFTLKIARDGRTGDSAGGWTQDWRHITSAAEPLATAATEQPATQIAEGLIAVCPPLPGAFYRAPQPGADVFVKVGDIIAPDTVIGIIETMKVMNSVPAGVAGEIVEILVKDGEMVDPDFVLMHVKPVAA